MNRDAIDPGEVERQAVLALALEPLVDKEGCTTRFVDIDENITLTNLISQGVNSGKYFYRLAERVKSSPQQPTFNDLYFEALSGSLANLRTTKHVNNGLLGLFFPLIVSRLTTSGDGADVCKNLVTVFKNSTREDVIGQEKARNLAWGKSRYEKRHFPEEIGGANLFEYYERHLAVAKELNYKNGAIWVEQLLNGMPMLQEMYEVTKKDLDKGLLKASIKAYDLCNEVVHSPGFASDYVGACMYLVLAETNDQIVY